MDVQCDKAWESTKCIMLPHITFEEMDSFMATPTGVIPRSPREADTADGSAASVCSPSASPAAAAAPHSDIQSSKTGPVVAAAIGGGGVGVAAAAAAGRMAAAVLDSGDVAVA